MKILHVTQGYAPAIGGTEWLIQRVSEELVRNYGDEVTVFTTNCYSSEAFFKSSLPRLPVGWEERNGVRIRRFPVHSRISHGLSFLRPIATRLKLPYNDYLQALSRGPLVDGLRRAIEEFPADVVAASSFPLMHMFAAQQAASRSGRPCVFAGGLHPEDKWGFDRPMIYKAIQQATRYIAYTDYEASYVVRRGASPERVSVVGVGVDPAPFAGVSTAEAKRRLGVEGSPIVAFIGQLGGHKGVNTVVKAMPYVWQAVPDAHLLIAGARTIFVDYLESVIARWPVTDQSRLVRRYDFDDDDKPWLYAAADVIAYPSGYESFGIAYLEAWASGKPVVGCRRGAVPWVIHAGRDGLLVEYQREQELAEAVVLLLRNPEWARSLGEAGRRKVQDRFTWPEIARRFRDVYAAAAASRLAGADRR